VARQPDDPKPDSISEDDERLQDPGFLICTAFCFLGIPPSLFKDLVAAMLEAAYKHYEETDPSHLREKFAAYHAELGAYSKIKLLGLAFRFLMAGELWFGIPVRAAAATAVRERLIARLVAAGLKQGSLVAAEQIVRRVLLYINLAIAANCGAYCGMLQAVRAALEITESASRAFSEGLKILQGIGAAVGQAVSAMLANAYGQLDPVNWKVGGLSGRASGDVQALGLSLFAQVRPASPWRQRTGSVGGRCVRGERDASDLLIHHPLRAADAPAEHRECGPDSDGREERPAAHRPHAGGDVAPRARVPPARQRVHLVRAGPDRVCQRRPRGAGVECAAATAAGRRRRAVTARGARPGRAGGQAVTSRLVR
jgi:hypothetical protein